MEEFVDNFKVIMGTFGYELFEPLISKPISQKQIYFDSADYDSLNLFLELKIKNVGIVMASGIQTPKRFVVFGGNHISVQDDHAIPSVLFG